MVSLVDIVPQKRTIRIAAGELELRGLGLRQIADLFLRFPELRKLFVAGAPDIDVEMAILSAPEAIAAIIAEAAGQPDAVQAIGDGALSLDELTECLLVVRDLTMPNGTAPFLRKIEALLGDTRVGLSGQDRVTNAPPLPSNSSPADMLAAK